MSTKRDKTDIEAPFISEITGPYLTPAVDFYETEEALVLLADIPGVQSSGLEIDLKGNIVTITGSVEQDGLTGRCVVNEFTAGSYFRRFQLGVNLDRDNITATLANGVLKITVPKLQKRLPRKIPISVLE